MNHPMYNEERNWGSWTAAVAEGDDRDADAERTSDADEAGPHAADPIESTEEQKPDRDWSDAAADPRRRWD
jgi:hypothetical protein